ncbi:hypothetical protein C8R46DRAFT_1035770 [Mycena filopes]|nr:hypothetical protein C8R46DRAFT_1035770 [Mycena filopes]
MDAPTIVASSQTTESPSEWTQFDSQVSIASAQPTTRVSDADSISEEDIPLDAQNIFWSDSSHFKVLYERGKQPWIHRVYFTPDELLGVARRLQSAKALDMPCFWGSKKALKDSINSNGLQKVVMFGYVVGEVLVRYTGVSTRYLDIGVPCNSTPTKASDYVHKAFRMQMRRMKRILEGELDEGVDWHGCTGYDKDHGHTIKVGAPQDYPSPVLGRILLIHLNIWPVADTERRSMVVGMEDILGHECIYFGEKFHIAGSGRGTKQLLSFSDE